MIQHSRVFHGVVHLCDCCLSGGREKSRSKSVSLVSQMILESIRNQIDANTLTTRSFFDAEGIARQETFLQQLMRRLLWSIYPGAPFERKSLAMSLLSVFLSTWANEDWIESPLISGQQKTHNLSSESAKAPKRQFNPFCPGFLGAGTVSVSVHDALVQVLPHPVSCLKPPLHMIPSLGICVLQVV